MIISKVPTVMIMLSSSSQELLRIHSQFPLLGLLLSVTNTSTFSQRIFEVWGQRSNDSDLPNNTISAEISFGPKRLKSTKLRFAKLVLVHIILAGLAGVIILQTITLSRRGVVAWACWTSFYPFVWLCIGVLQHVLYVLSVRLCLGDGQQIRAAARGGVWNIDLTKWQTLKVVRPKFAWFSSLLFSSLGFVNYVFGTLVFSSLQLVTGVNAMKVMITYGVIGAVSRLVTIWLLEVMFE